MTMFDPIDVNTNQSWAGGSSAGFEQEVFSRQQGAAQLVSGLLQGAVTSVLTLSGHHTTLDHTGSARGSSHPTQINWISMLL